jgi:hypothetical protein
VKSCFLDEPHGFSRVGAYFASACAFTTSANMCGDVEHRNVEAHNRKGLKHPWKCFLLAVIIGSQHVTFQQERLATQMNLDQLQLRDANLEAKSE